MNLLDMKAHWGNPGFPATVRYTNIVSLNGFAPDPFILEKVVTSWDEFNDALTSMTDTIVTALSSAETNFYGNQRENHMTIQELIAIAHGDSLKAGWHDTPRDKGTFIALMHSELSECLEGERKDLMDDKLPHRKMAEVELADTVIRIADYCGLHGYDLEGAIIEKLAYNRVREDHKQEIRDQQGGKKF